MKLLTFYRNGSLALGARTDSGILDVAACAPDSVPKTMDEFITAQPDARQALADFVASPGRAVLYLDESKLKLGPCVPSPVKIVGIGLNYREYAKVENIPIPEYPRLFSKFSDSVRATGEPVIIPASSDQVDYEAELCVVIGKDASNVDEAHALEYVLGYCNANDVSSRDFQNLTPSWVPGKCCDSFAPIGPYLVTKDEVADPNDLHVRGWWNGVLVQDFRTSDMIRSVEYIVAFTSKFIHLRPGDIIFTGTSVGLIMNLPESERVWLKEGDTLEVEIDGFGRLVNPVVKERLQR